MCDWKIWVKKIVRSATGTTIPSEPVIAFLQDDARIFVGVEGGIVSMPAILTPEMYRYYWHQIY